jgi:hypothetical protein
MTAIALNSIPSRINTAERLLTYAAMLVENAANDAKVNVQQGQPSQPICSVAVQQTADGIRRYIIAAYIPIDPVIYADIAEKRWMAARDVTLAAAHTVFNSN